MNSIEPPRSSQPSSTWTKTEYLMKNDEDISIFTRLPQKFESWSFYARLQSFDPATLSYSRFENWESLVSQKSQYYSS